MSEKFTLNKIALSTSNADHNIAQYIIIIINKISYESSKCLIVTKLLMCV